MFILFYLMLYRAPVDTSPVTEGVTLFKYQLLLVLLLLLLLLLLLGVNAKILNLTSLALYESTWLKPNRFALNNCQYTMNLVTVAVLEI